MCNRIFDYDELNEDVQKIKNIFEKLGFSYHRELYYNGRPHHLDVLVDETDDYVGCHIEFYKHLDDWYEVIFYKKKKTIISKTSYSQLLEFNRWLCDGIIGITKLLKKLTEDYPWLKGPSEIKLVESFNLENIGLFSEINMDDDNTADYIDDKLRVSDYDITQDDVDYIIKVNNKLGLDFKHEIKIHGGGKEKKVLMVWYNHTSANTKFYLNLIVNVRRIKDDYFYVFTDARGKYNSTTDKETKYFLCDGLFGLTKFFKHIKKDYLTF